MAFKMKQNNTPAKSKPMKIKKGDKVVVISGKDKGRVGVVTETFPKLLKVKVEKVNIATIHVKPDQKDQQGGIKKTEKPIHISKVMLTEPQAKKDSGKPIVASRVGLKREVDPKTGRVKTNRYLKKGNIPV